MPLWSCLSVVLIASLILMRWRIAATTTVLLIDWGLCTWIVSATGQPFNPMAFAAFDMLAAVAILQLPACRLQTVVAATYIIEMIFHAWFVTRNGSFSDQIIYWYGLHYVAWGQLWIVAIWTGGKLVQMVVCDEYPWRGLYARRNMSGQAMRRGGEET